MNKKFLPFLFTALGLTAISSMAQTTFQGTGVVQATHHHWETSAGIQKPSIFPKSPGSHGAIVARIALSEPVALPSGYEPSAILTVYSQWPAKESVVFSGPMPVEPIFRTMVMPPNNEPLLRSEQRFRMSVGDPRDKYSLRLAPGNYRAEVLFYTQLHEAKYTDQFPKKVEAGGSAINFVVGAFNIAHMSDARGEVRIVGSVSLKKNATPAQIAAMTAVLGKESQRVSAGVEAFLAKHSRKVDIGPAKRPWAVDSMVYAHISPTKAMGLTPPGFINEYFVVGGESYTEQANVVSAELRKILSTGNLSRAMPGGTIVLKSTTNLKFTPKN